MARGVSFGDGSLAAIDFSSRGAIETIGRIFAVAGFARDSSRRDRLIQNVGDHLTQIDGIGPARALDVLNSKGFKQ